MVVCIYYVFLQREMRYPSLRYIASIVLLAIYLPTTILSSTHVHHETVDTRDDCLQCVGHFESHHHHEHDCLYCHFLGLDYLGQVVGQSVVLSATSDQRLAVVAERTEIPHYGVSLLRAPPMA